LNPLWAFQIRAQSTFAPRSVDACHSRNPTSVARRRGVGIAFRPEVGGKLHACDSWRAIPTRRASRYSLTDGKAGRVPQPLRLARNRRMGPGYLDAGNQVWQQQSSGGRTNSAALPFGPAQEPWRRQCVRQCGAEFIMPQPHLFQFWRGAQGQNGICETDAGLASVDQEIGPRPVGISAVREWIAGIRSADLPESPSVRNTSLKSEPAGWFSAPQTSWPRARSASDLHFGRWGWALLIPLRHRRQRSRMGFAYAKDRARAILEMQEQAQVFLAGGACQMDRAFLPTPSQQY